MKATGNTKTCNTCKSSLPLDAFHKNRSMPDGLHSQCKKCGNSAKARWRKENPEKNRAAKRVNRLTFIRKQGVEIDDTEYARLLDDHASGCAICGHVPERGIGGLSIDHDHSDMRVRGLLCGRCNTALGLMNDDIGRLAAAIDYLSR